MTTTARRRAADGALAALVIGVELGVSLAHLRWNGQTPQSRPGPFGIMLLIAGGGALVLRRRYPSAVLGFVLAATLGAQALGARFAWLALIVAFFTAVLRGRRFAAIASLVTGYGVAVRHSSAEFALLLLAGLGGVTGMTAIRVSRAVGEAARSRLHHHGTVCM